jgi:ABC-type branched-subunit amino acid transport system ATPase component
MNREEMEGFMRFAIKYAQETNTGVLLGERTMAAVINYCTRLVIIDRGRVAADIVKRTLPL